MENKQKNIFILVLAFIITLTSNFSVVLADELPWVDKNTGNMKDVVKYALQDDVFTLDREYEYTTRRDTVLRYEDLIKKELKAQGGEEHWAEVLMAIMEQESKGTLADIMQSSESAGLPIGTLNTPEKSVKQGVKHFLSTMAYIKKREVNDIRAVSQGYNFGAAYSDRFVIENTNRYSYELNEKHSMHYGGTRKISYSNPFTQAVGKPYRYNFGVFHYGFEVMQYMKPVTGPTGSPLSSNNSNNKSSRPKWDGETIPGVEIGYVDEAEVVDKVLEKLSYEKTEEEIASIGHWIENKEMEDIKNQKRLTNVLFNIFNVLYIIILIGFSLGVVFSYTLNIHFILSIFSFGRWNYVIDRSTEKNADITQSKDGITFSRAILTILGLILFLIFINSTYLTRFFIFIMEKLPKTKLI